MKSYEVMVGPIMANTDEGLEVVVPAYRVQTIGARVKYHQDYFQIIDRHDVVVFAIPHSLVMWCREVRKGNDAGEIFVFSPEPLTEDQVEVVTEVPAEAEVDDEDEHG